MSLKALLLRFENKPFKTAASLFLGLLIARLVGDFVIGFIDGLIAGFTNGV